MARVGLEWEELQSQAKSDLEDNKAQHLPSTTSPKIGLNFQWKEHVQLEGATQVGDSRLR